MLLETSEKIKKVKEYVKNHGMKYNIACKHVGLNVRTFYAYNASGKHGADYKRQLEIVEAIYKRHLESGMPISKIAKSEYGLTRNAYNGYKRRAGFNKRAIPTHSRISAGEFIRRKKLAREDGLTYQKYFKSLGLNYSYLNRHHSDGEFLSKWSKGKIQEILDDKEKNALNRKEILAKYKIHHVVLGRMATKYGLEIIRIKKGRGKAAKTLHD